VPNNYIAPPADVVAAYESAVSQGRRLVGEALTCSWPEEKALRLLVAAAAFQGLKRLGTFIAHATDCVACPHCQGEIEPLVQWGSTF